jgi:glucose/arabinose dehydrogenase
VTIAGSFHTMSGTDAHQWTGPLLLDVLNAASVTDAPGKKTHFQHVILARGSDGYTVAVAIGEIDSRGEGKQVIVATQQDGKPLPSPRLVVPNDRAFARGVRDLVGLEVR